ncbi:hypothetical protein IW137_004934, partial [Coemansia sp. RSA 1287]
RAGAFWHGTLTRLIWSRILPSTMTCLLQQSTQHARGLWWAADRTCSFAAATLSQRSRLPLTRATTGLYTTRASAQMAMCMLLAQRTAPYGCGRPTLALSMVCGKPERF